ncbi:hypothetical protein HK099_007749, partial [Clydaea vesicula]
FAFSFKYTNEINNMASLITRKNSKEETKYKKDYSLHQNSSMGTSSNNISQYLETTENTNAN